MNQTPLGGFTGEHPCVFVLSTGRAGTRTLASLLNLSKGALSYHEPKPLLYGLSQLSYFYDTEQCFDLKKEAFLLARRSRLEFSLSCRKGYVETSPQITFLAPIILRVIPEAKFIHLIRDPRDFIRSGMRRGWYVNHPMDITRLKPHPDSKTYTEWQHWSPYRKIIWLWQETNLWIEKFVSTLDHENCLFLHAEEIFESQLEAIEKLYCFLNSKIPSKTKIKMILAKKINAQKSGSFPKYSEWHMNMYRELKENLAKTAEHFGYRI